MQPIEHVPQLRNHWWWRPGWRQGRHFYACHLSFEDQPNLHALVDLYQDALRDVTNLDLIPRPWLHLTMEGIGFVDEIPSETAGKIEAAIRTSLSGLQEPRVTFHRPVIVQEAIYLPALPSEPIRALRLACRAAIASVLGTRSDPDDIDSPKPYRPHVSVAYVNADSPVDDTVRRLESVEAEPCTIRITNVKLMTFHRDRRMYEWTSATPVPIG